MSVHTVQTYRAAEFGNPWLDVTLFHQKVLGYAIRITGPCDQRTGYFSANDIPTIIWLLVRAWLRSKFTRVHRPRCTVCGQDIDPDDVSEEYLDHPYDYRRGCRGHCLACWLGVGTND